ncbi:MAG: IS110 family transposase [Paludibacter sp.]|jgi:transposase|nr:IS110 family transposase [Paludibacter sp.]
MEKEIIKQNVGIDVSKDDFKVCVSVLTASHQVKIRGSRTFNNDLRGFKAFLEWTQDKCDLQQSVNFTLEATGVYHECLAYFLFKQSGFLVHIVLPNKSKNYGKSLGIKSKTDKIDARILAQMGLEQELRLWHPVSPELLEPANAICLYV